MFGLILYHLLGRSSQRGRKTGAGSRCGSNEKAAPYFHPTQDAGVVGDGAVLQQ